MVWLTKSKFLSLSLTFPIQIAAALVFLLFTTHAGADTLRNIYAFNGSGYSPSMISMDLFQSDLGTLEKVDVSVRGIVSYQTFHPDYDPARSTIHYVPLEITHNLTSIIGLGDFGYNGTIYDQAAFNLPAGPMQNHMIDIGISYTPDSQFHSVNYSGYTSYPAVYGTLDVFNDASDEIPADVAQLMFNQIIPDDDYHSYGYLESFYTLLMQVDYEYIPASSGTTPINIGSGLPLVTLPGISDLIQYVRISSFANDLFPEITSIDDVPDDRFYALATTPTPEPGTLLLIGTGLLCLAGIGRKTG